MSELHDCGADAAAYVLGALDPVEADAFRLHLRDCAICRDEVEALRGVVQALPMAAPQHPVSHRLRRRVLQAVSQQSKAPAHPRRWLLAGRQPRARALVLASVAAVVVAAGSLTAALELSGGPAARVVQAQVSGISGSARLRVLGSRGELIVRHLSPPPPGHIYEVWVKPPNQPPAPIGVLFDVTSAGSADVGLPRTLSGISKVMVTSEPVGGTRVPTHAPVIVVSLT